MQHRRQAFLVAALATLIISAIPAAEAVGDPAPPARTATLGPDSASFTWDGPSTLAVCRMIQS